MCVFALAVAHPPGALAAWSSTGNPICVAPGAQYDPISLMPWIVWTDERDGPPQLYALFFDWGSGMPFDGAPVDGIPIAPSASPQRTPAAYGSSFDGALIVVWSEDRGTGSGADLYAMRLLHLQGTPDPNWPAGGLPVCTAPGEQRNPRVLEHYERLAPFVYRVHYYVTWEDTRDGTSQIYASDATEDGTIHTGWPTDGVLVSTDAGDHRNAALLTEGTGFATIWEAAGRVCAQAVSETGAVPANGDWPAEGRVLSDPNYAASNAAAAQTYSSQFTVVAWEELRPPFVQVRAQGWDQSFGQNLMPAAIPVVDDTSARPHAPRLFTVHGDDLRLFWQDDRSDGGDIYYNSLYARSTFPRLRAEPPGQGASLIVEFGEQGNPIYGWNAFWQDSRSGIAQIYSAWTGYPYVPGGVQMAPTTYAQTQPSVSHGVFCFNQCPPDVVVWTDRRHFSTAPDIYAQVLGPGGPGQVGTDRPLPTRLACSGARPTPTRGGVTFQLQLPLEHDVEVSIVDVSGRAVRALLRERLPAGEHTISWDGLDASGRHAAPGLYWLRGRAGEESFSRRVVMISR